MTLLFQQLGPAAFPKLGSRVWLVASPWDSSARSRMIPAPVIPQIKPCSIESGKKFFSFLLKEKKKKMKALYLFSEKWGLDSTAAAKERSVE